MRLRICNITPHFVNAPGYACHMKKLMFTGIDWRNFLKKSIDITRIGGQEVVVGVYNSENFPDDSVARRANRFTIPGAAQPFLWRIGIHVGTVGFIGGAEGDEDVPFTVAGSFEITVIATIEIPAYLCTANIPRWLSKKRNGKDKA